MLSHKILIKYLVVLLDSLTGQGLTWLNCPSTTTEYKSCTSFYFSLFSVCKTELIPHKCHSVCMYVCPCVTLCISETVYGIIFIFGMKVLGHCPIMPIFSKFKKIQNGRHGGRKTSDFKSFGSYLPYYAVDHFHFWHGVKMV